MAKASKYKNDDELINHTVAVRYRVYGAGNLRTTLLSLQEVDSNTLAVIPMQSATDKFPTILANFGKQRTQIQFGTTQFDETFTISKIIAFVKPVSAGYPI